MLVVHGLIRADGRLGVWAEDSELPHRIAERSRGPMAHPFAAAGAGLQDSLGLTGDAETVTVLLPSRASAPEASPELVRDPLTAAAKPRGQRRLRPWLVPVVTCDPDELEGLTDTGHRLGSSARYLSSTTELAKDLVARGRALPALIPHQTGPEARWQPALSGADSARFAALRDSMPPAVRAEQTESGEPAELLHATLNSQVDKIVRSRLADLRLAPPRRGRVAAASVATEAWLKALTGEPRFETDPALVRELGDALDDWHASGVHESPVRTCFRLRSPDQVHPEFDDDEEADWRLEFVLQAVDDPSVLVPAAEVWHSRDGVLHRWVDEPEDLLLADLGRASRLYPGLDTALHEAHPAELRLDTDGAYEFLTHSSLLDQAGFGVLLPSWWGKPDELSLTLSTSSHGTAGAVSKESDFGLNALVDYRWDLALGDSQLTEAELAELAAAKVPLVRMRGQWVHVDQRRLAAGLAFLERARTGQMAAGQVLLRGAHAEDSEVPLPVTQISSDGWLGDLLSGEAEKRLEPIEPPDGFGATLRPYQRRGLAWLTFLDQLGLGACLADDMGLGKTIQVLALEARARQDRQRDPSLVVCPMSLIGNWQREAEKFAPELAVYVHHGKDRLTGEELAEAVAGHDLVVTTYATATRDAAELGATRWDRVVIDEAQNIKNSRSRQSRAVRQLPARHRIALTGTPVENRLAELWSIMDFANPGVLGPLSTFRARFAVPIERDNDTEAAARLRQITGPFVLRRLKTDPTIITDLPDKIEMKQLCNLTTEQASLYKAVVEDMFARIAESEGIERRGLVLATMSKLKQVCNHPAQLLGDRSAIAGRSGKLLRLEEILEGALADGDKALCFTQFTSFGGMLVPYLAERFDTEVLYLHGGTPKKTRDEMIKRFQEPGGPSIFLLSLKAGGTGLTLTAASHVIHLDRWWNPAVEDQATDRAFRIGQQRNVQVRKLTCIGTLEEKIDAMIEEKKALAQMVVGAGDEWVTELSTAQLRELVTLSPEAIGD